MKNKIIVRSDAEIEIQGAFQWYEDQEERLGAEFLRSLDAAISLIGRSPRSFSLVYKNIRRVLVRRFPFGIFYILNGDRVIILALLHVR